MELPEPHTEAWNKLGPEARRLARMRHNSTPIRGSRQDKSKSQKSLKEMN